MVIDSDERNFINTLHAQGKTPEQIAAALVQRRALAEVEGVLKDAALDQYTNQQVTAAWHYVFLSPPDANGSRQPVKVYTKDLEKFCGVHGLNTLTMLKVASGEIDSHRGWSQGPLSLRFCAMTPRAKVRHKAEVEERMKREGKANPAPTRPTHTVPVANPPLLPPTTFQA